MLTAAIDNDPAIIQTLQAILDRIPEKYVTDDWQKSKLNLEELIMEKKVKINDKLEIGELHSYNYIG